MVGVPAPVAVAAGDLTDLATTPESDAFARALLATQDGGVIGRGEGVTAGFVLGEAQPDETEIDEVEVHAPFGEAGSWRWALYGGGAVDIAEDGEHYNLHWAASYFLVDDLSVNFELGGLYFNEPSENDDAFGANFNVLFRWHFISEDTWSVYGDAGAGMIGITEEVPLNGTNFNFTPQAGVGFTMDVGDDGARLMTGVRWHHMSNARIRGEDDNPGRDAVMAYVGLSFPWGSD